MRLEKIVVLLVAASLALSACAQPAPTTVAPATQAAAQATVAPVPPTAVPAATVAPEPATAVPAAPTEPAAAAKTKVQVMSWWDYSTSKPLQDLKSGFEAKNPDLEMEFIQVASQYADKVLTMIAGGGDMPDVIMLAMDKVPLFADRGAILNLDEYVTAEYKEGLYPVVLQALSYQGSVYAMPRDVSSRVMFLHKGMFDAAGVPIPEADWTWADFREIASKLSSGEGSSQQWGFYFPKYVDGFYHFLRCNGGALVSDDGAQSLLSQTETLDALHFLQDMIITDGSVPSESQAQQFGSTAWAPMIAGKVAMSAGSLSTVVSLEKDQVDYRVLPLPLGQVKMNTAFVNAWSIPKGAKNPELSWRVLDYFASKEAQQIVLDTGMGLPGVKGVDTTAFLNAHPDNHYFIEAMDYAEPFPTPLYGTGFFALIKTEFDLMWLGQLTPEVAVANVDKTANQVLSGEQ